MKNLTFSDWVRRLKIAFVGAALSLSVVSGVSDQVWAQSKRSPLKQQIQSLQQSNRRWIQVNLSKQRLIAWEGKTPIYAIAISSGKNATPTRTGIFQIQSKHRKTRMRGRDYDVPNVPYAMFYDGNYGIHGAYWHRKFGTPVSRGCVNLAPNHAKWLFNWASPGTTVFIHR
ncbi:MAG: L,D-transpeptidase [Heteroscytonema crispum UTEX LB 1556]